MISNGRIKKLMVLIVLAILLGIFVPMVMAREAGLAQEQETVVRQQVRALMPLSRMMVDRAQVVLEPGLPDMSARETEIFLTCYDPAATGTVDADFVQDVIDNYQKIQKTLDRDITIAYDNNHDFCSGKRLYFTVLNTNRVCPYFFSESGDTRKARALVHEVAHIALFVRDKPYYRPTSKAFAQLTPRGLWTTQLPLMGPIVREMVAGDTLYHPDTYAHFAQAMSSQPGAMDAYLDQGPIVKIVAVEDGPKGHAGTHEVTDSWVPAWRHARHRHPTQKPDSHS